MPEWLVMAYETVVLQSQLNFEAIAVASNVKLSGTSCSCKLSSCCITWADAPGESENEMQQTMSAMVRCTTASPASPRPCTPLAQRVGIFVVDNDLGCLTIGSRP